MKPWMTLSWMLVGLCIDQLSAEDDQGLEESRPNNKFQVDISGLSVTIKCPKTGSTTLKFIEIVSKNTDIHILENYSSDKNGMYSCNNDFLYLHAYVCETCTEVSPVMMVSVVIADCLITLGVCLFVYMFCKRKPGHARENGFAKEARKKGNKEHPPPVPNPDYEPLQKKRQDVYDGLNQGLK
ncbi:hypothetical protein GDO81_014412 [Engystomops pustulosus]|uniref:T-cell surface glycoprotein CD3 epsilon chain n=1 Tax=Engystomops pustulosus TaxID=76066 RepID=A0AAV7BA25_ENGPU|nr:hypothetical protein GDO81_014412 [Engystomops pustulosus]